MLERGLLRFLLLVISVISSLSIVANLLKYLLLKCAQNSFIEWTCAATKNDHIEEITIDKSETKFFWRSLSMNCISSSRRGENKKKEI